MAPPQDSFPTPHRHGLDIIPDEILYKIFLEIVRNDFEDPKDLEGFHGGRSPWNIAAVCSNWRRVCLGNARLWSYIVIGWHQCEDDSINRDGYDGASVVRVYLQLERSRSFALHVDASYHCECACGISMLRAVGRECGRWKSFSVNDSDKDFDDIRDTLPYSPVASQLETLIWKHNSDADDFHSPFTELTSLRSVTLIDFQWSSDPVFPWSQLTHLNLESFYGFFDRLLDLLPQCTAMTNFKLGVNGPLLDDADGDDEDGYIVDRHELDSVVLLNLTSLDLVDAGKAQGLLLPYLRFPNLRNFAYNIAGITSEILLEFIKRSSCSFTQLRICAAPNYYTLHSDLSILKRMPLAEIESLSIYGQRSYSFLYFYQKEVDTALRFLIADTMVMCPRLKHLELHDIGFDPMLLVQVVNSRRDADSDSSIASLQSMTVHLLHVTDEKSQIDFYKRVLGDCLRKQMLSGLQVRLEGRLSPSWTEDQDSDDDE